MAINSRSKGISLELQVAKAFSEVFGLKIRRTPLSGGWSHDNPEVMGDLVCITPGANFPYCVECKNAEYWKLESLFTDNHKWFDDWWKQTINEAHDKIPILVFSKRFTPAFAAVKAQHWLGKPKPTPNLYIFIGGEPILIMRLDALLQLLVQD